MPAAYLPPRRSARWPWRPCLNPCFKPDPTPCRLSRHKRDGPTTRCVTLNGWTLPWRMNQGVKEFHLVAEPVVREMAPGMKAHLWGYNGQSPGPTIEVVEGDQVRIFRDQQACPSTPRCTFMVSACPMAWTVSGGLTQKAIHAGQDVCVRIREARRPGTFMYHPHADEMTQMAMGMMGMWITHPRVRSIRILPKCSAISVFCSAPSTLIRAVTRRRS